LTPPTGARVVKIDLYTADPQSHPWGSDWKPTALEQWTAVLSCSRSGKSERCAFVDGVWWSVVIRGGDARDSVHLPAPGELSFTWTPRGRIQSWDVIGDRSAFWAEASDGMTARVFREPGRGLKPDDQREVGAKIEQGLVRDLAAALEWELPKDGVPPEKGWTPTQTPWVARRWLQSTASDDLRFTVTGEGPDGVALAVRGTATERAISGSVMDLAVETEVLGTATFRPGVGIVRAQLETRSASTSQALLAGHVRFAAVVSPWADGDPSTPGDVPAFTLP
ncbi:MAG: hypothetical protein ABMB14_32820, partial [Myxococcota bacterium]